MISIEELNKEAVRVAKPAWVTLGMPFDVRMAKEKEDGIIDVEALILATLLVMEKDRFATDIPAWINCFKSLINYQKLKTLFRDLPGRYRASVLANMNQIPFQNTPKVFKNAFGLQANQIGLENKTIELRMQKINRIEYVAEASLMIKNRLIYGTGFRADLITLKHIENIGMKGTDLAKLLCANNSTVSRILNDLKASRFLNQDGERLNHFQPYPGMFISVMTVTNLCEMMDATQFAVKELKDRALGELNFKQDAFGRRILEKLPTSERS